MITIPNSNVLVSGGNLVEESMIVDLVCRWNKPHKTLVLPQIRLIGDDKTFTFELNSFGYRALGAQKLDFLELFQFLHIGSQSTPVPTKNIGMKLVEYALSKIVRVGFRVQSESQDPGARMVVTCALSTKGRKLVLESDPIVSPKLKGFFSLKK
jgi:hypothetical protein